MFKLFLLSLATRLVSGLAALLSRMFQTELSKLFYPSKA
jgi:hypothetical protein